MIFKCPECNREVGDEWIEFLFDGDVIDMTCHRCKTPLVITITIVPKSEADKQADHEKQTQT